MFRRARGVRRVSQTGEGTRAPRMVTSNEPRDDAYANAGPHAREKLLSRPLLSRPQEFDAIKAQRVAMQQQLEAYKADSAAQLKATETQTLELLSGLVERLETDRGKLRVDQEEVRQQVRNIEAALPKRDEPAQMRREDGRVDGARVEGGVRRVRSEAKRFARGREANRARHGQGVSLP